MDANEEHAPQGEGKNVARRRREQQRRALGRKVAWLAGLLQESAAHHTGTKHSPNTGNLKEKEATLERRIIALEQLVGTLVRWQAGGGKVVPGQDEDGGEEMGTQASTRRTLAQGSTLARSWRPASTAESAHVVEGGERKVAEVPSHRGGGGDAMATSPMVMVNQAGERRDGGDALPHALQGSGAELAPCQPVAEDGRALQVLADLCGGVISWVGLDEAVRQGSMSAALVAEVRDLWCCPELAEERAAYAELARQEAKLDRPGTAATRPQEDKEEDKGKRVASTDPQKAKGLVLEYQGYEVGARVRIKKLKARKDLNFRQGHVIRVQEEDLSEGRVPVRLERRSSKGGAEAPEEEVQVRLANLHRG